MTKFCHMLRNLIISRFMHAFCIFFAFYFDYDLEENVTKYVTNRQNSWDCRDYAILILSHFCPMWQIDVTKWQNTYNINVKNLYKNVICHIWANDVTKMWQNYFHKICITYAKIKYAYVHVLYANHVYIYILTELSL